MRNTFIGSSKTSHGEAKSRGTSSLRTIRNTAKASKIVMLEAKTDSNANFSFVGGSMPSFLLLLLSKGKVCGESASAAVKAAGGKRGLLDKPIRKESLEEVNGDALQDWMPGRSFYPKAAESIPESKYFNSRITD